MTVQPKIKTVTFDTNVFPADALKERACKAGITVSVVSVSAREVEGSSLEQEVKALQAIPEIAVWGQFFWGQAVWAAKENGECLEYILSLVSNRSFPLAGERENLTRGQLRQLRDAIILCTHIRSGRDLLVSNDSAAFISDGRRQGIESKYATRIMTVQQFESYLSERERGVTA
jgi:hypothetical protein